jgi:DNA primase
MASIDWGAIKARHALASVAWRTGLDVRTGGRAMVCCPIPGHADTSPSMQLDLDRGRYRCYGCGAHGDVIQWVQDIEAVSPIDAIRILDSGRPIAGKVTSPIARSSWSLSEQESPDPDRTPEHRVQAANALAWRHYSHETLHDRGVAYLLGRAIDVSALEAETHGPVVGHTPNSKTRIDGLITFMAGKGFSETELMDAGLAVRLADGCLIDFFRDRVILPTTDDTGAIGGLLGRDATGGSRVKYLNPPTTATYRKSQILYRPTRPLLRSDGAVIVCEGPIDALAIAAWAAAGGVSDRFAPLAACGTALSDHQIRQILVLHGRAPVLAGDGDEAGRQANLDWAGRMLAHGRESVVVDWPEGHDPASWLAARGSRGLLAVFRRGCLDDHSGILRPRHCGAVLTAVAFPDNDQYHAPEPTKFLETVARAAADLSPAGRRRYLTAAASAFAAPVQSTTRPSSTTATCSSRTHAHPVERIDL